MVRLTIIIYLFCTGLLFGGAYFDGPYLFLKDRSVQIDQFEMAAETKDYLLFQRKHHTLQYRSEKKVLPVTITLPFGKNLTLKIDGFPGVETVDHFQGVEKIVALSDIHGNFKNFKQLLINAGVIDERFQWTFKKGHLVITGDLFDRGGGVTEGLWLIRYLQQEAEKSGGRVHFLLGNHEVMVLRDDLRFIHGKYQKVMAKTGIKLDQYFGKKSYFGRWLRGLNSVIKINDTIFLHGGLSPVMVTQKYTIKELNQLIRRGLNDFKQINKDSRIKTLFSPDGPHWYRGYFEKFYIKNTIKEPAVEAILNYFKGKQIVVGHTTHDAILPRYRGDVIGIDGGMKRGSGSALLWRSGVFYTISLKNRTPQKIELEQ